MTSIPNDHPGNAITFAELRDVLGHRADDHISICGRNARTDAFSARVVRAADADAEVRRLVCEGDVWAGVNPVGLPVGSTKRGSAEDVVRLAAAFADLDIKPGSFASLDAIGRCIDELSSVVGTRPSVLVFTGHGVQPYWPIEAEAEWSGNAEQQALLRAFGRLVAVVAAQQNVLTDNVFDLSRVLRLPGTINWKDDTNRPLVRAEADNGGPLGAAELAARLAEVGIDWRESMASGVGTETVSAPSDWIYYPDRDCGYVAKMVRGWQSDPPPTNRHAWALSQAIRIEQAHRLGCWKDKQQKDAAIAALDSKFRELLKIREPKRFPRRYEIPDLHRYAAERVSRMADERAAADLSGHMHEQPKPEQPLPLPMTLDQAHAVFTKWLGGDYDTDALDAMLATVAVEKFADQSDPVWLLLISGSGNAKTETVQALSGIRAEVTSSLSSDAALLSATPRKDKAKDASGGLLRKMGETGTLAIKDVTSILSMNRDIRARVLAALREVYDGSWVRDVGTDGGRRIEWQGRIAVIGAVTTAWDTAHSVIATMGDRFVLVRLDSTEHRKAAGRKAIRNTGSETKMRAELADAVAAVIAGMNPEPVELADAETECLLAAADLVTRTRTAVETDYRGDVIDAHAPEMPTRFAKQLAQIMRGAIAIGMARPEVLRLAIRCASDSMPPLRWAIIQDLAEHPGSTPTDVRRRIDKPRSTVDRQLQALHMLGLATLTESVCYDGTNEADEYLSDRRKRWYYSLSENADPRAIMSPEMLLHMYSRQESDENESVEPDFLKVGSNKNGDISGDSATTSPADASAGGAAPGGVCSGCGQKLLLASSIETGQCEGCRRSRGAAAPGE